MSDPRFMRRALQLAELGLGSVSPNPIVGCVIVHDGEIIGEGYHQEFGAPHAEVNAINSVDHPELLASSEVYVTLEPCAHFGKTPPCAHLLANHQVGKVHICNQDPNPKVNGKGIEILRHAGVEVELGLLSEEGLKLNRRFLNAMTRSRPYVILKWAQTSDGFIARRNGDSKWISSVHARQLVHKWRSEEDAIMVGTVTAAVDNPRLTVRDWMGRNPVRIVIDRQNHLSSDLHIFDGSARTICFSSNPTPRELGRVEYHLQSEWKLENVMTTLLNEGLHSIIIEGGTQLLTSFIEKNLWDEARIFTSEKNFRTGISGPALTGTCLSQQKISDDVLTIYQNEHNEYGGRITYQ